WPLRTTSRCPSSSRSPACASMYAATSASNAAASIRRAPSRTISSIGDTFEAATAAVAGVTSGSATTVSMGVPSRPALARGPYSIPVLGFVGRVSRPTLVHRFRALLLPYTERLNQERKELQEAQAGVGKIILFEHLIHDK